MPSLSLRHVVSHLAVSIYKIILILLHILYVGMDPFGAGTIKRTWDDGSESLDNYKRRLHAAFEFFTKLGSSFSLQLYHNWFLFNISLSATKGVKHWSFHDRDISPEGQTLEETNAMLDEMTDLALELQKKTGVQLLWNTCNLFAHPRYLKFDYNFVFVLGLKKCLRQLCLRSCYKSGCACRGFCCCTSEERIRSW